MSSATLELAEQLIALDSVTPEDKGCQQIIAKRLAAIGFCNEAMPFEDVSNLWAVRGEQGPLLVFAGHTDVVPSGTVEQWSLPPFEPTVRNGFLFGRGAADMKGSLAAMVVATERFVKHNPRHSGRLGYLITSDEEGDARHGTVAVIRELTSRREQIDWAIVGEPSSTDAVGDVIKNGRRGSMQGRLIVNGKQGHVAYPQLAENPIHQLAPAIAELAAEVWDEGNSYFPATSFQISNIKAGTGATNVIPGTAEILFNFRFNTESSAASLQQRTRALLKRHGLAFDLAFTVTGEPFITEKGRLLTAVVDAVRQVRGAEPDLSTAGGTSDGRFIAPTGAEVVELGPSNKTIHQIDECVAVADLEKLTDMYYSAMCNLLA